mmetsp:Transcript_18560/g.59345  ORF Transcript_18560/g.59345 Transcript_18560/m.59345 type:complete len:206 (+) Transcript_18560:150-767(+)
MAAPPRVPPGPLSRWRPRQRPRTRAASSRGTAADWKSGCKVRRTAARSATFWRRGGPTCSSSPRSRCRASAATSRTAQRRRGTGGASSERNLLASPATSAPSPWASRGRPARRCCGEMGPRPAGSGATCRTTSMRRQATRATRTAACCSQSGRRCCCYTRTAQTWARPPSRTAAARLGTHASHRGRSTPRHGRRRVALPWSTWAI